MQYDLGDCTLWEYMFPSNEKPQLLIPDDEYLEDLDDEEVSIVTRYYHGYQMISMLRTLMIKLLDLLNDMYRLIAWEYKLVPYSFETIS